MNQSRRFIYWFLVTALLFFGWAEVTPAEKSDPAIYFQSADPAGDDNGFGTYQYPTNLAFQPYHGLFDITDFKVWSGPGDPLYFDTTFTKVTNPWMAPEGFIHQNLRIFVDSVPDQGMTTLPQPGGYVAFNPRYAWDFCLKIVGWGSSQLIKVEGGKLVGYPLKVALLNDGLTIRAAVPGNIVGIPTQHWHYYVMVGSYDGFGADFFRKVTKAPGEWVIGGGVAENLEPQVLDILAPEKGSHSQINQLRSFDPQNGKMAELYPMGPDLASGGLNQLTLWVVLLIILGLLLFGLWLRKRPGKITWFWVRIKNRGEGPSVPVLKKK